MASGPSTFDFTRACFCPLESESSRFNFWSPFGIELPESVKHSNQKLTKVVAFEVCVLPPGPLDDLVVNNVSDCQTLVELVQLVGVFGLLPVVECVGVFVVNQVSTLSVARGR